MALPLDITLVGAGRRGFAHGRAALQAGARIASVFDPDTERARALASDLGGVVAESLEEALAVPARIAAVTSPPPCHAEQTTAALRAGRHVILEKPIALTMAEARRVGQAAEEAGRQVVVCQQQRYTVAAQRAREALAGRKAALAHIWLYRPAPDIPGNWRRAWGGGHVVEWAIHPIDFCRYVLGDVESVYAAYTDQVLHGTPGWDNWDAYSCTLRFECGAVGSVATTYAAWPGGGGGSGLDIVAEGMIVRWRAGRLEIETPEAKDSFAEPVEPTAALHCAFYAALAGDTGALRQDYRDAVKTLATVLACNRSNETGHLVRVADLLP